MKKSIFSLITIFVLLFQTSAFAKTPSVYFNGEQMTFESDPYITEERTMVPFRAIFEAVGASVMWDGDTRTVIAVKAEGNSITTIALQIDSNLAFVNDKSVTLDVPAQIKDDFTFVPLRFVMESLGADVAWDGDAYKVTITTK